MPKGLLRLRTKSGADVVLSMMRHLLDYGEEKAREAIGHWPEAKARSFDKPPVSSVPPDKCVIDCEMTIEESIHFDFSIHLIKFMDRPTL